MSCYLYILRSERSNKYYIGQTQDVRKRLDRHNRGGSRSTKAGTPWVVIHVEKYTSRSEAPRRERYLKSPAGWSELKNLKKLHTVGVPERSAAR